MVALCGLCHKPPSQKETIADSLLNSWTGLFLCGLEYLKTVKAHSKEKSPFYDLIMIKVLLEFFLLKLMLFRGLLLLEYLNAIGHKTRNTLE